MPKSMKPGFITIQKARSLNIRNSQRREFARSHYREVGGRCSGARALSVAAVVRAVRSPRFTVAAGACGASGAAAGGAGLGAGARPRRHTADAPSAPPPQRNGTNGNPVRADHELFLQAFEKPTQIYRFLRTRNMLSPIFLNRTLSYMKQRMSRSHKTRDGFKVDSLLDKILQKNRNETQPNCLGGYMTLTFLGFYDKGLDGTDDYQVKVETLLLKICHKKRKDSSSAIVEVSVGSCSVPLNPSSSEPPAMASAVSISSETFSPSQGPNVKSYMLLLRVAVQKPQNVNKNNELRNGESDEPAHKRLKVEEIRLLGSELIVYDKHNRCLLSGGEYDLVLRDVSPTVPIIRSPHKALTAHWETIPEDSHMQGESNPFDIFNIRPTLKLKLSWSQEPSNGLVTRPRLYQQRIENNEDCKTESNNSNKENNRPSSECPKMNNILNKHNGCDVLKTNDKITSIDSKGDSSNGLQIIYQFLYNNNSRQQTEACEDLHCPWCSLDCGRLYALLKHLKLCHSRFSFAYSPILRGARIDVSINEQYDGSYAGSPHEACSVSGTGGSGGGPVRRVPLTNILVCRPLNKRPHKVTASNNLTEFLESDDNELNDAQRPYITGHNRLYHHTITCLPIYPKELELDSEEETDPLWLQQKTMMMIDEFTDVNEGEKELMKMWNLHVMKYNFVGDCQIPIACQMFLQLRGRELLEKNLYRNFILHMCSLHDFGLITSVVFYQTMQILIQMLAETNATKQKMRENILMQRENWKAVGIHQQIPLADQKPSQLTIKSNFSGDSSPAVRRKTSSIQNTNRTVAPNFNTQSIEAKRKLETPSTSANASFEIPQRRKSILSVSNASVNSKVSATCSASPQMPLRRKSAGNGSAITNQSRKRLSLQERKNST